MDLQTAILISVVLIAAIFDVRAHRIPNWLVAVGLVFAIVHHAFLPAGEGATHALSGFGVGLLILIPLYAMRTLGAGDVKLVAMVGAFVGPTAVITTILATMIVGGILAVIASAQKRMLRQLASNLRTMVIMRHIRQMGGAMPNTELSPPSVGKMPYALAIAGGTLIQIFILRP